MRNRRRPAASIPARIVLLAMAFGLTLLGSPAPSSAGCFSHSYTAILVHPTSNWSDSTLWNPNGYPGTCAGDLAFITLAFNLVVDIAVPSPVTLSQLGGNVIDIPAGGALGIAGSSTVTSGAQMSLSGGSLTVVNGAT